MGSLGPLAFYGTWRSLRPRMAAALHQKLRERRSDCGLLHSPFPLRARGLSALRAFVFTGNCAETFETSWRCRAIVQRGKLLRHRSETATARIHHEVIARRERQRRSCGPLRWSSPLPVTGNSLRDEPSLMALGCGANVDEMEFRWSAVIRFDPLGARSGRTRRRRSEEEKEGASSILFAVEPSKRST